MRRERGTAFVFLASVVGCLDKDDDADITPSTGAPPTAALFTPAGSGPWYSDHPIALSGSVSDTEDAADALTVRWTTDREGDLGLSSTVAEDGMVSASTTLGEGLWLLSLEVTDTDGNSASDSVTIAVNGPNRAPECGITTPEDDTVVELGEELRFAGTATDPDVSAERLTVTWSSDIDGELRASSPAPDGTLGFTTSSLTAATHRITLLVTDDADATCDVSIYVTVGSPPTLTLDTPADDDRVNEGDAVAFTGSVSDGEDRPEDLLLTWFSSLDGVFSSTGADSTGALSLSVDDLQAGEHDLEVTVTDSDGLYAVARRTLTVNALPTAPTVTLSPDPAVTTDDIVASASDSTDPDASGTVTYTYAWTEDGAALAETSSTLPASATTKDRAYRVVVTPSDDLGAGESAYAEVVVSNSAPVLTGPALSATTVQVGDTVTCSASATDADAADMAGTTYAWHDGSSGPTYTVVEADDPGDSVTCTATADDGDGGTDTGSVSATISNTDPVLTSTAISPATGRVGDTLTCVATATDADGGTPAITYAWPDGSTSSTYVIAASDDPGDIIACTATASDPDGGTAIGSASATVENTPPVMGAVTVSPSSGRVGDTITCSASATDADGGAPTITYAWPDGSTGSTFAITSSDSPGSAVTCLATADDGDGGTDSGTATATVDNTSPVMGAVSVSPSSGQVGAVLTCSASSTDADGGVPTITYSWSGGSTGSTYTIMASDNPGDTLTCTATADDGDGGTDSGSATAIVDNTAPLMGTVSVSPSSGQVGDTLTCTASATDPDGDTPALSYTWSGGSTGSTYVIAASDNPGDTITCTATAEDGDGGTDTGSASVMVSNTAPVFTSVSVSPSTGQVGDTLTCSATATDADGGIPSITYSWPDGTTSSAYVISITDDPGDSVTCTATALDADGATVSGSASATVENTAPVLSTVSVSPSSGRVGDTLTCSASATDADGGSPTMTYTWSNGSTGSTYVISSSDNPGDALTCTATAADSEGATDSGTGTAVVDNTAPVMGTVSVSPASGEVGHILTCSASATDIDGGTPTIHYVWSGGTTGSTYVIPASDAPGTSITCTATTTDTDGGADTGTASATVDNSNPVVSGVTISPGTAAVGETITCGAIATDANGDVPTITYTWSTGSTGATYVVTADENPGDAITCTATATDIDGGTASGEASTTVVNSAPVLTDITVSPSTAYTDDTLVITLAVADADGDAVSIEYDWYVDAVLVQTGGWNTLNGSSPTSGFDRGQSVYTVITASDGTDETVATTPTTTILNSPPTAATVEVIPTDPREGDDLICEVVTASTDADGDSITYSMSWTVDGVSFGASDTTNWTGDTVDGSHPLIDEVWECTVTPYDGDSGSPTTSSVEIGATTAIDLSSGSAHSCIVEPDHTLTCWGRNDYAQLGGSPSPSGIRSISVSGYDFVDAGYFRSAAILTADSTSPLYDPTASGVIQFLGSDKRSFNSWSSSDYIPGFYQAVANGLNHVCAMTLSGHINCWGDDSLAQVSDAPTTAGHTAITSGRNYSCALDSSGQVDCWGADSSGVVSNIPTGSGFTALSTRGGTACAVNTAGCAECWGDDSYGIVSSSTTVCSISTISLGDMVACATTATGAIECWGATSHSIFTDSPSGIFSQVELGGDHACALDDLSRLFCWGDDTYGQVSHAP